MMSILRAPAGRLRAANRPVEVIAVSALVVLLVVGRSLVFVLYEQSQFDADQAVMGLMAKHIVELRAFPFYQYAQNYVFVVEAWLAAPFVGVLGLSVASLRLPLLLLNIAAGGMLVALLARELQLRPLVALVPALLFVAAPPVLAAELLTALGGNIEPFVYVLLLWVVRSRPIVFGAVFLVGFLNREFTAYAVSALLVVEALQGQLWRRDNVRQKAIAVVAFATAWAIARLLHAHADMFGPGTAPGESPLLTANATSAVNFICPDFDPSRMAANLLSLVTTQMATLLGAGPIPLMAVNIASPTRQGITGLWPIFGAAMIGAALRIGWLARQKRHGETASTASAGPAPWFALYMTLVGLQSGVVWALSRCEPLDSMTLRYGLLSVFVPIAVVGLYLAVERRAIWRTAMILFLVSWTLVSIRAHADVIAYYRSHTRPSEYRLLADELVGRGIRYVRADYWMAYMIDFLTDERVTATATDYMRVLEYDVEVDRHIDRAVLISRQPCPGGEPIRRWYLCKPNERRD